jgi:parallel beta-helix repeat protein
LHTFELNEEEEYNNFRGLSCQSRIIILLCNKQQQTDNQEAKMEKPRIYALVILAMVGCLLTSACSTPSPVGVSTETSQAVIPLPASQTPLPTEPPSPTPSPSPSYTPTPTFTPTPTPVVFNLEADGSGDYPTLEEAVQNAPEGATLSLGAGVFRLEAALEIDKPLNLVGQGIEETEIVSKAADYTVHVKVAGIFSAEGITFRHEGSAFADAVEVEEGQVSFKNCRFSGGVINPQGKQRGSGLRLREAATGVVQDCVTEKNFTGFWILAEEATLERNLSTGNKAGMAFGASSKALARNNQVEKNDYNGIVLSGESNPTVEDNTSLNNGNNGFIFVDQVKGIVRRNICESNKYNGMFVGTEAAPVLEDNLCNKNGEFGLLFYKNAGGEARHNQCSENKATGIGVQGEAHPLLEGNLCNQNAIYGIIIAEKAKVEARKNQCNENKKSGILVTDSAQATLEENTCSKNGRFGIAVGLNSVGVLRRNTCNENLKHGILVAEKATATLEENICNDNIQVGIAFLDNSSGSATRNQCSGNETGIYVEKTANPELVDNDCHDNTKNDVLDER